MSPNTTDPSQLATSARPAAVPPIPQPPQGPLPVTSARERAHIDALPPSARATELAKRANTFASSGKTVYVHYVEPALSHRRAILLSTGKARKRYTKTAAQLWQSLQREQHDEWFFWYQVAKDVRLAMSKGELTHESCLRDAGREGDARVCIWHAEVAVGHYLGTILPSELEEVEPAAPVDGNGAVAEGVDKSAGDAPWTGDATICITTSIDEFTLSVKTTVTATTTTTAANEDEPLVVTPLHDTRSTSRSDTAASDLPSTLPDRFTYTPNMLHSHFAHYNLNAVRKVEGKHQIAMLRQLADLLDKSGRELFYYYAVPHLCKTVHPARDGSTVTSMAGDVWRFLPGQMKDSWASASSALKKMLGNGDVDGLEVLQLDSLEPEVLRLHGMTVAAIQSHEGKKARKAQKATTL